MLTPDATLKIYKSVDNTIVIHGVYYGNKASKFVAIQRKFNDLVRHMLEHHHLTCYSGRHVQEYKNFWTYTVYLHPTKDLVLIDDIVSWYQEIAQKSFYTPEQYPSQENELIG